MTRIGKILAIFLAVGSLAFAGFAIATTFGGPDWGAIMREEFFRDYRFTRGGAPDFTWTAFRNADDQQVAASKKLPEVLAKVMDDVLRRQQEQLQVLSDREPQLQAQVEMLEQAKAADEVALEAEVQAQRDRLAATRKQEAEIATQVVASTNEAQKLENLIVARREDILRLTQQVEEIRADQFRLSAIQKQLQSLLVQLQGDTSRASLRADMLKQQLESASAGTEAVSTGALGQ